MTASTGMELPRGWGGGPFEQLLADVATGATTFDAAMVAAERLGDAATDDGYVAAVAHNARRLPGRAAVRLMALLQRGCAARPDGPLTAPTPRAVTLGYLNGVARYLCIDLDAGVALPALAVADDVEAWLAGPSDVDPTVRAECLEAVGNLCTRYVLAREVGPSLADDLGRAAEESRDAHAAEHWAEHGNAPRLRMPEPDVLLRRGEAALRAAVAVTGGDTRGRLLAALGGTLAHLGALGAEVDPAEATAILQESLALSDKAETARRVAVVGMLLELGVDVGPEADDAAPGLGPDDLVEANGPRDAVSILLNAVGNALRRGPDEGERALERARVAVDLYGDAEQRMMLWRGQAAVEASRIPGGMEALALDPPDQAWDRLDERMRTESWGVTQIAAALVLLADELAQRHHVADGPALLATARGIAPVWARSRDDWLRYVELHIAAVSVASGAGSPDPDSSLGAWARAVELALDLRLDTYASMLTRRAPELALSLTGTGAEELLWHLRRLGRRIEDEGGDLGVFLVTTAVRRVLARLVGADSRPGGAVSGRRGTWPEVLLALQIVKGARYAAVLADPSRFGRGLDERGQDLLDDVHRLEQDVGTDQGMTRVDSHLLLAQEIAHLDEDPNDPLVRLRALRRTFDQHLRVSLLGSSSDGELPDPLEPFAAMDDRTVLLDYVLGTDTDDRPMLVGLVGSSADWTLLRTGFAATGVDVTYEAAGVRATGTVMTPLVHDFREALQEPSEPDEIGETAAALLAQLATGLLGGIEPMLDDALATGRTVLQVQPHGALHFLPFHLLPFRGRPLADRFTVVQVPNRTLLTAPRPGPAHRRRASVRAFGLGYADRAHGLRPLAHTVGEATAVAGVFGAEPEVDEQATEVAVVDALRTARFVHVAAHGAHDYDAPSFHCVYLTPDGQSDGLLRAHELVHLDLRGLELVTLSACETALGHFDVSDNPSGLPAALLAAGAACVVGTLWDVRSDASERFFVALYREIAAGAAPLDAFGRAQAETRKAFPTYRDWGAFVLMGDGLHR